MTVSLMESCTSGLIASMITDTEGASSIFEGSFVTYSNRAKAKAGVSRDVIDRYGVYSKECAEEMALAAQRSFGSDIAVGITGTTGNTDPNNSGSIKGEAFYCVIFKGVPHSYHIRLNVEGMERHEIKQAYADDVFEKLATLLDVR